ncbi:MAG TPA: hypothetical protein VHW23_04195 [Kofleriaceae bacterium]|nr:hypothetical protein [Kofleriaceae bacterium]
MVEVHPAGVGQAELAGRIDAPPMTYLQVNLAPGEHWRYQPPRGHEVTWVAVAL